MSIGKHKIELDCDCPTICIVEAAEKVDIKKPMDVRWLPGPIPKHNEEMRLIRIRCSCNIITPSFFLGTFSWKSGMEEQYWLTQCPHCLTVYWRRNA